MYKMEINVSDVADVRTGFGAKEMVSPPFEHRLAAARPTKQEDALLARVWGTVGNKTDIVLEWPPAKDRPQPRQAR